MSLDLSNVIFGAAMLVIPAAASLREGVGKAHFRGLFASRRRKRMSAPKGPQAEVDPCAAEAGEPASGAAA